MHGNIREYTKNNPQANRLPLVSSLLVTFNPCSRPITKQLKDVVDGLEYLHSKNIVHGDLKGVRFLLNAGTLSLTGINSQTSGSKTTSERVSQISTLPLLSQPQYPVTNLLSSAVGPCDGWHQNYWSPRSSGLKNVSHRQRVTSTLSAWLFMRLFSFIIFYLDVLISS
jgi:serine/threonine protein kinase